MGSLKKTNKKLQKAYGGAVTAHPGASGSLVLEGRLESWQDIVAAGSMAADKRRWRGIVNKIQWTGGERQPVRLPTLHDTALEGQRPDVLVIGAGITGSAIARELTRYNLSVLLIDKEHDVALHASSRNDGMVHPGIDLIKGTAKHHYNLRGNRMYKQTCHELGVPLRQDGQYLCFAKPWLKPLLYCTLPYWKWSGLPGVRVLNRKKLHEAEPNLNPSLCLALYFPSAGSVCPYNLTIAFAENALQNGAEVSLDTAVLDIEVAEGKIQSVKTNRGTLYPRVVVNAAGTFADDIAAMAGDQFFSIHPRRGTNAILDNKLTNSVTRTIVSSIATSSTKSTHSKGGGIVRTVEDNLLVGPDAVEVPHKEDFSTEAGSVSGTMRKQQKTAPALSQEAIITYFTGVRAPTYEEDFVITKGLATKNLVHAAGIQSPGITAAPAIAQDVAAMAAELLGGPEKNPTFNPIRPPIVKPREMRDEERDALIGENPDYGVILCRCEEVSRGEIMDALHRPLPCDTVDGVKRRVRPGMGRCQGGFCGPLVAGLIAAETGTPLAEVQKSGLGSPLLYGETKGGAAG